MRLFWSWFCGLIFFVLCNGCGMLSRAPYEKIELFDVGTPRPETIMKSFSFGVFRNISGSDRRFMRFEGKNRVGFSETQRFLQAPEVMLERFLREALIPTPNQSVPVVIDAVIRRIGFDVVEKRSVLSVEFSLRHNEGEQRCSGIFFGRYGDNITPAEAMNHCFNEALSTLRKFLMEQAK